VITIPIRTISDIIREEKITTIDLLKVKRGGRKSTTTTTTTFSAAALLQPIS